MNKTTISLFLFLVSTTTLAKDRFTPSDYACAGIEKRIDHINSRMRAGYSAKEGERLKQELRALKKTEGCVQEEGVCSLI